MKKLINRLLGKDKFVHEFRCPYCDFTRASKTRINDRRDKKMIGALHAVRIHIGIKHQELPRRGAQFKLHK